MTDKCIYLTFDGAPHPPGTLRILEVLEELGVKATFFMEGKRVDSLPGCAERVYREGHEIGNHSYNHPDFTNIKPEACKREVKKTEKAIYDSTGVEVDYIRPPSGRLSKEVEELLLEMGYKIVLWSYSIKDWEGPDAQSIAGRVMEGLRDQSIIVFHDKVEWIPATLKIIIPAIRERGYEFRKIPDFGSRDIIK